MGEKWRITISCGSMIEIIGMIASHIIFISICIKSNNDKSNITMRLLNTLGSLLFVIYGISIKAYSIVYLNFGAILLNVYHIYKIKSGK